MKWLAVLSLLCSFLASAQGQSASNVCAPSPDVERDLKRLDIGHGQPVESSLAARKQIFDELLQKYPDDFFVHQEAVTMAFSGEEEKELVERYRKLEQEHPRSLQYQYLYARALVDVDTPQAMDRLKRIESVSPNYPWAYLQSADVRRWGKWADTVQLRADLNRFFEICPDSIDAEAWFLVQENSSPEMAARYGKLLRARLMTDLSADRLRWRTVWTLDFKAATVAQHAAVRAQIEKDVKRLETMPGEKDARALERIKTGYELAEDSAGVKRTEELILTKFPQSTQAEEVRGRRWEAQYPYPEADASDETKQAYYRMALQRDDEVLKRSPDDSYEFFSRFYWLSRLNGVTGEQLTQAADQLLKAMERSPIWQVYPPVRFQIAEAYNKKKIHAEQISGLVEAGLVDFRDHTSGSDRVEDTEGLKMNAEIQIQAAGLLVDAATELKNPEIARAAVKQLDGFTPDKVKNQSDTWKVRGKFAELEGRKLDALLMYQATIKARPTDFHPDKTDEVVENEARLWKELGGSSSTRDLWEKRMTQTAIATESRWEVPHKVMPDWQLSDLEGHTWKRTSLEGKTVLINVWGTWCGPCIAELPQFQKLYEQMKGRSDVAVLSFNVDDEVGKVEPFIQQKGYTFPVLLAKDYVNDVLQRNGIPRVWIVDSAGKWQWERVGFDPEHGGWQESVMEKMREVGKAE